MIQAVRNNYNINFKSSKSLVSVSPKDLVSTKEKPLTKAEELIYATREFSPIQAHLDVLCSYGIRMIPASSSESPDRINICHNLEKINPDNIKKMKLRHAAGGDVKTLEDARLLMGDAIQDTWRFFIKYAVENYGLKIH